VEERIVIVEGRTAEGEDLEMISTEEVEVALGRTVGTTLVIPGATTQANDRRTLQGTLLMTRLLT